MLKPVRIKPKVRLSKCPEMEVIGKTIFCRLSTTTFRNKLINSRTGKLITFSLSTKVNLKINVNIHNGPVDSKFLFFALTARQSCMIKCLTFQ